MKIYCPQSALAAVAVLFFIPVVAWAAPNRAPEVQVIDLETREVEREWRAFDEDYDGGIQVEVGDLGGDGVNEFIVAQSGGEDAAGIIRTFRVDNSPIAEVQLTKNLPENAELDIAVGDVDGDGADEIIATIPHATSSMVYILDGSLEEDASTVGVFEAFPEFSAGVTVATGNVLGDERDEIIVGTGPGPFPLVRIFNEDGVMQAPDISPFSENDTYGLNVATANTGGGEYDDVLIGYMAAAETWVKSYQIDEVREYPVLAFFRAWSYEFKSGVQLGGIDIDADGTEEIAVTPAGDQRSEIKFFRGDGEEVTDVDTIWAFGEDFRGGAHFSVANVDRDKAPEIIVSPRQQQQRGDTARAERYIEVNLSEQIEYVWEDGYLSNVFLVSTGLPGTPTPTGDFSVMTKIANHLYEGPGYYLPNTPWNLRFHSLGAGRSYYLHSAYWHNNFGNQMSHGCINMRYNDAKWLFYWAEVGTPVWVHY
ncbi:L,D-transpeptidase [Patescibacteria group bacterium]